jgi:hypothetical protein
LCLLAFDFELRINFSHQPLVLVLVRATGAHWCHVPYIIIYDTRMLHVLPRPPPPPPPLLAAGCCWLLLPPPLPPLLLLLLLLYCSTGCGWHPHSTLWLLLHTSNAAAAAAPR